MLQVTMIIITFVIIAFRSISFAGFVPETLAALLIFILQNHIAAVGIVKLYLSQVVLTIHMQHRKIVL